MVSCDKLRSTIGWIDKKEHLEYLPVKHVVSYSYLIFNIQTFLSKGGEWGSLTLPFSSGVVYPSILRA